MIIKLLPAMNRILLASLASFSLAVSALSEIPSQAVWPVPNAPAGGNPATFAVPREEWVTRVQKTLDQTKDKQFDLIFDGDSITDFWQSAGKAVWMQHYGSLRSVDFGISADKTEHLLWRLQQGQVNGMDPKLVVLMIGTNNTGRDSAGQVADGVKAVTAEYLKRCPHAHILLLGIFPRGEAAADPIRAKIADINKQIAGMESDRVTFLDIGAKFLAADGTLSREIMGDFLHPTAKGYQIWADAIQPVVEKYLPQTAASAEKAK